MNCPVSNVPKKQKTMASLSNENDAPKTALAERDRLQKCLNYVNCN